MNLRQLEIFVAVAETGSFSRAAENVLLTQSTVSQHVAALESELGVTLFDRTARGAELTEGGQLLRQHARQVLAGYADLRETMARFRGVDSPQLTIGASNIPANYLIPCVLPVLAARHPGVILNVVPGDSREIVELLLGGTVALAVVGQSSGPEQLIYTPLLADTLHLVVGDGHPWRERAAVELEELASTPMIVRETGSGSRQAVEEALRQAGFDAQRLRVVAHLGSNEAVKQTVMRGFGAAFLSSLSFTRELACGALRVVPVRGFAVERRFWLATRRERTLSPAAQAFANLLVEICGDRGATVGALPDTPAPGRCR